MVYTIWTTDKKGERKLFGTYESVDAALDVVVRCVGYVTVVSTEIVKEEK